MTVHIAVLPDPEIQQRIFGESHWRQLSAIGSVARNDEPGIPTPDALRRTIAGADIAITSWRCRSLDEAILREAPNLKAVIHAAGTVKGVVTPDLWKRGIRVSSGNGPLGRGVAETTLGLTISSLKNMWRLSSMVREGGWSGDRERIRELYQVTIGVVGAGQAGRHYIRLLQQFDVTILVYDPVLTDEQAVELGAVKVGLEELLRTSDVVSIHAPSIDATYHMFNRERLALMKDDAILINTARGSLVDEEALVAELRTGRLFACLDVTEPEPPRPDHPFRTLPNCVLIPHIAGAVNNGIKRIGQFAIDEVKRVLAGEAMLGEVKQEQLSVLA